MNIFIIPSWYPTPQTPIAGIFTKEQVYAFAKAYPEHYSFVSLWGHDCCEIPARQPWKVFESVSWYLKNIHTSTESTDENICEILTPGLYWTHKLPRGGWTRIYKQNKKNLEIALNLKKNIDVIHAHVGYPAGVIARKLSLEFNIPYIITEHMGPFPFRSLCDNGKPISILQDAYHNASATVAVSPYLAHCMKMLDCGYPVVIPNFVDENLFFPALKNNNSFTFFTLCAMKEGKGIETLLQAIAKFSPNAEKIKFIIAGDGPNLKQYQSLAKNLGLNEWISWPGALSREEAAAFFRNCDAFVLPSRLETFGVVYAEAIACGKPVIATRCGGPESIVNDQNGILIDIDNVDQLADALNRMMISIGSYNSDIIRNDFIARFSKRSVAKKLLDLYQEIII